MTRLRSTGRRAVLHAVGVAAIGALVLVPGGCQDRRAATSRPAAATQPKPTSPLAGLQRFFRDEPQDEELSVAEIQFRSAYGTHCGKCHKKRYKPKMYSDRKWREFLPAHARESKVDPNGTDEILKWMVENN